MDRRQFLASAASFGIVGVWATRSAAAPSRVAWREDRALYPQGVASGDPDEHSVILWTRRPFDIGDRHVLTVEVAQDADFRRVVAIFCDEMADGGAPPMVGVISLSLPTIMERIAFAAGLGVRTFQFSLPNWGTMTEREVCGLTMARS